MSYKRFASAVQLATSYREEEEYDLLSHKAEQRRTKKKPNN